MKDPRTNGSDESSILVPEADSLKSLQDKPFKTALEELRQLLSQRRRAFLFGAGCSKCAGLPLMFELTEKIREKLRSAPESSGILEKIIAQFAGSPRQNIEDYMSELVDLIAICERRSNRQASQDSVSIDGNKYECATLLGEYALIKKLIGECISTANTNIDHHRLFVRTIHNVLRSGKAGPHSAVDYFSLNYDTLVEDALALERVTYADGFEGGATGWWNLSTLEDKSVDARVLKLHGGIDWRLLKEDPLPRRIRKDLLVPDEADPVLIWPAATKYRETQRDPYAQLIAVLRQALRPSGDLGVVLAIIGYSFGDAHINAEVESALKDSHERLTCVVFTEEEYPTGELGRWTQDPAMKQQIRVYARKGCFHGDNTHKSESDLPWWKFEVLTRLLGGER